MRAALAFSLLLAGCGDDATLTELVVVVDTDLSVPDEVSRIGLRVVGSDGRMVFDGDVDLSAPGAPARPLTLGLTPAGDSLGPIVVAAVAIAPADAPVVSAAARTSFVEGRRRMLRLLLERVCVGVPCAEGTTCRGGACDVEDVAPEGLPAWTGEAPPPLGVGDAGPPAEDGGVDAGVDAGVDGGAPACDPRVESLCECTTEADCVDSACVAGFCLAGVAEVAIGPDHMCALPRRDGPVLCRGQNTFGQLGYEAAGASSAFGAVVGLEDAVAVSVGGEHSCALRATEAVVCWGANASGQLGDGSRTASGAPVVVGVPRADAIASGGDHTCALRSGGVYCWGRNDLGQVGDGTREDRLEPNPVPTLSGAVMVATGAAFTCAIVGDARSVQCWGSNTHGVLGDPAFAGTESSTPVEVVGVREAAELALGRTHACVRFEGGLVSCWGQGDSGQIGDGATEDRATATPTLDFGLARRVYVGFQHSCALRGDDQLHCWGSNGMGQLVLEGVGMLPRPQRVSGPTERVVGAQAGGFTTCLQGAGAGLRCAGTLEL